MAFLKIPITFIEGDAEAMENLGLTPQESTGMITINTNLVCAYNQMDNGQTMIRMANGDCAPIPMSEEEFEKLLSEVELIVKLSDVYEN